MNSFFTGLGERCVAAAARRGVSIRPPELDAALAAEILDLARVVARSTERHFAPLASFVAGVATERLRAAGGADPGALAAYIREVREELERATVAPEGASEGASAIRSAPE